jgi:peptide/nickel transport system ATP-binding protein
MALLEINNLDVSYMTKKRPPFHAVKKANLRIAPGEVVGLVGESGSGKSTLGTAVLRLLDPPGRITGGKVVFDGKDITHVSEDEMRPLRWSQMSTVFQSSMNALNPVVNIGKQFKDVIEAHTNMTEREIEARTAELLKMVDIDPSFVRFYPHELSGGMKQRVAIALALVLQPKFVLLDEPTTGLDVVVQRSILENLKRIQREFGFAVLMISHDLGAIMEVADRVAVMLEGELVDDQPARSLLLQPKHPYSRVLIGSYEDLWKPAAEGAGDVPLVDARGRTIRATFGNQSETPLDIAARLGANVDTTISDPESPDALQALADATASRPAVVRPPSDASAHEPVLVVDGISKHYTRRRGFKKTRVDAVSDVSFTLRKGYITALVGQSGSGKSTIGRLVTGIEKPDSGSITFRSRRVDQFQRKDLKAYRSEVQLVFQDPYSALNPAHPISHTLARPLDNFMNVTGKAARKQVEEMLEQVGLQPASQFIDKYPHQMSGGQRQRVVVARALLSEPDVVIADEPTSMLDVTIRAEILEILNRLVRDKGIAMLYITHDLLSARSLADEILVLNRGRVVEDGDADHVIADPQHEYTRLLLSSIPNPFAEGLAAD